MKRWAVLIACLWLGPALAQDIRPVAREEAELSRPVARAAERTDLSISWSTRPWVRADVGLWAIPAADFVLPEPQLGSASWRERVKI